ncbi:MAG: hypothetical protein LJF06_18930 [Gemmatimonadetes bacterium]|nr:hypothetical protein [Gemmatimonadota bacterium]
MRLLHEIKERRLIQYVGAYLAAGFGFTEAASNLFQAGMLPAVVNPLAWALYLFGIPSTLIFAWFHGAPGRQHGPRIERILQGTLVVLALSTCTYIYRNRTVQPDLAAETGLPPDAIAVLYFDDASPNGNLGYVADGMTEALINELSNVRSLTVISKNGVLPYRGSDVRPDSIARALKVGTLIEGSVDQRGDRLRINTQLVDGLSGADIDRAAIEIPAGKFLAARDSLAGSVSRLLRRRLGEDVQLRQLKSGTSSVDAWSLAQRAERLTTDAEDNYENRGDPATSVADFRQADSLLAMAEQFDSKWVEPVANRAHIAYRLAYLAAVGGDTETERKELATGLAQANRALVMDPRNANALEQRGTLKLLAALTTTPQSSDQDRLVAEAKGDLQEAVKDDPTRASAYAMLSFALYGSGDRVGVVLNARRALEEDAYLRDADRIYDRLVYADYDLGEFNDARSWCDRGHERFPQNYRFVECKLWLMAAPGSAANVDSAWTLLDRLDSLAPEPLRPYKHGVGQIMLAGVLRNSGLADSASSVLSRVDHSDKVDVQRNLYEYQAAILATTGTPDTTGAIAALRRWVAMTPGSTLGKEGDLHWWWKNLRNLPEFQQFEDKAN